MKWLFDLMNELINAAFWGKITVHFESGRITRIQKEESIKPPKE